MTNGKPDWIAVDFDGTCVAHDYPRIGRDIGAQPVLRRLIAEQNARLILYTMRSGKELEEAIAWFSDNGIPVAGINTNPAQHLWTNSPKAYANLYIDDAALGCPLIHPAGERPYVDWQTVEKLLCPTPPSPSSVPPTPGTSSIPSAERTHSTSPLDRQAAKADAGQKKQEPRY